MLVVVGLYQQVHNRLCLCGLLCSLEIPHVPSSLVGLHFSDGAILMKTMIGIVILWRVRGLIRLMTCACACVCHILVFFGQMESFAHKVFFGHYLAHVLLIEFLLVGNATVQAPHQIQGNLLLRDLPLMEFPLPLEDGTTHLELFHLFVGPFL